MPLLVGLLIVSVSERGNTAIGKLRQGGLVAALMDPLSLFADRSPGERGAGPLLSTKPEQRVLSTVRDRDPGMLPAADDPVFASALPGAGDPPFGGPAGDDPLIGPATFSGPFYPFARPRGRLHSGTAPLVAAADRSHPFGRARAGNLGGDDPGILCRRRGDAPACPQAVTACRIAFAWRNPCCCWRRDAW